MENLNLIWIIIAAAILWEAWRLFRNPRDQINRYRRSSEEFADAVFSRYSANELMNRHALFPPHTFLRTPAVVMAGLLCILGAVVLLREHPRLFVVSILVLPIVYLVELFAFTAVRRIARDARENPSGQYAGDDPSQ